MDTINQEVDLFQSVSYPVNSYELIKHCYHYLLERQIVHLRDGNCLGCQNDCPGQKDHKEGGCLSECNELVIKYFAEAVIKLDNVCIPSSNQVRYVNTYRYNYFSVNG